MFSDFIAKANISAPSVHLIVSHPIEYCLRQLSPPSVSIINFPSHQDFSFECAKLLLFLPILLSKKKKKHNSFCFSFHQGPHLPLPLSRKNVKEFANSLFPFSLEPTSVKRLPTYSAKGTLIRVTHDCCLANSSGQLYTFVWCGLSAAFDLFENPEADLFETLYCLSGHSVHLVSFLLPWLFLGLL